MASRQQGSGRHRNDVSAAPGYAEGFHDVGLVVAGDGSEWPCSQATRWSRKAVQRLENVLTVAAKEPADQIQTRPMQLVLTEEAFATRSRQLRVADEFQSAREAGTNRKLW